MFFNTYRNPPIVPLDMNKQCKITDSLFLRLILCALLRLSGREAQWLWYIFWRNPQKPFWAWVSILFLKIRNSQISFFKSYFTTSTYLNVYECTHSNTRSLTTWLWADFGVRRLALNFLVSLLMCDLRKLANLCVSVSSPVN